MNESTQPVDVMSDQPMDDLRSLMQSFMDSTRELERTHETLQSEVSRLKGELAAANERLRRSQELAALGEMAAGIAHEIRNPLGSIQLYVQALGEDLAGQDELQGLCEKIESGVIRMNSIVEDVLLFAREMRLETNPISLGDIVAKAVREIHHLQAHSAVELLVRDSGCVLVQADLRLMTSVVANLLRNAIEAIESHDDSGAGSPQVEISMGTERIRGSSGEQIEYGVLRVIDNGPGIPATVIERMFHPFFTTRATGTGLGLAIVHRIVDAHEGEIHVTNIEPTGARIDVYLPLAIVTEDESPSYEVRTVKRMAAVAQAS